MSETTIITQIDFEQDGRQVDYLYLPHSPHSDAWGAVAIPIAVIKHGSGPTIVMTGGNHGDEYEGPITLTKLIRELDPAKIQGRLIIISALNTPAVLAGNRVSPLDGKNMNRCFPGQPQGTVTEQIAYYTNSVLYPMADAVMDLHSGGSSLEMVPSGLIQLCGDAGIDKQTTDAVVAFDAPLSVIHGVPGDKRTSSYCAVAQGKPMIGSELGSGGGVSIEGLAVTERGVFNALNHFGVVGDDLRQPPFERRTQLLEAHHAGAHVFAPAEGVFQPAKPIGAKVEAGEICGWTHFLDDPMREPIVSRYASSGIMFSRRAPGKVVRGSCVAVIGRPVDD